MLLRHTTHYMIASAASALLGLLSAMVFTRALSPSEYGVYVVGVSTAGIISAILFSWVRLSALRFQSEGGSVDVRATSLTAYLMSVCAAPLALIAAALFGHFSLDRTAGAVVFAVGLGLFELGQELMKARSQTLWFMYASILRSVAAFGFCLAAVSFGGGGLGQLIAAALAYFVTAGVVSRVVWNRPVAPFNAAMLKTIFIYGVPITVSGFVYAIHAGLDRLIVAYLLGDTAAGLYGVSADLVRQIILIPASSVAAATIPLAVQALANGGAKDARAHLEAGVELLSAILLPAVVGLALTSSYVAQLVLGPSFRETSTSLIPILAFAWLFQSISQSYVHISFHLAKKPHLAIVQAVGTLLVNALVVTILVRRFGLPGAAASLVIAEVAGLLLGFALTRFAHPLPLAARPLLRIGLATGLMALAILGAQVVIPGKGLPSFVGVVATGMAAYGLAALLFDIAGVRTLVQDLFGRGFATTTSAI
jgi:O-antigen/teichoic acid export membrane protein